jgi:hypothetical protein
MKISTFGKVGRSVDAAAVAVPESIVLGRKF